MKGRDKVYQGAIISVEDVVGEFSVRARRDLLRKALREHKYEGKLNSSELDLLWYDPDGAVTLSHGLREGFWEAFAEVVSEYAKPEHFVLAEGAESFAEVLPNPNIALLFTSPPAVHNVIIDRLGWNDGDICYIGCFHYTQSGDLGVKRNLGVMLDEALASMRFYDDISKRFREGLGGAVYVDRGTEIGFAAAKGRHIPYWAVDHKVKRGKKTHYVFQTIVHSLQELKEKVYFANMVSLLELREENRELEREWAERDAEFEEEKREWRRKGPEVLGKNKRPRKDKKGRDRH